MAHWTPSKSHTYEGAGQFCGRLIFSFGDISQSSNSHLFFDPYPIRVFCVFALHKMENYLPSNADQKIIVFCSLSVDREPCQCEQEVRNVQILFGQDLKISCKRFLFYKQYKAAFSLGISLICLAQFQMLKCMNINQSFKFVPPSIVFSVAHICLQYVCHY